MVQFICLRDQAIIYLSSKNLEGKGAAHEENMSDIYSLSGWKWRRLLEDENTIENQTLMDWLRYHLINFKISEEEMPPMRINRLDILYVGELHLLAKHQSDTILEKVYDYLLANTFFMIIFWQTIRHLLYDNLWTNHESEENLCNFFAGQISCQILDIFLEKVWTNILVSFKVWKVKILSSPVFQEIKVINWRKKEKWIHWVLIHIEKH